LHLDFFFDLNLWSGKGDISIGFVSGPGIDSMKADFNGWRPRDLYLLIERTIRTQFAWDAAAGRLRQRQPELYSFGYPPIPFSEQYVWDATAKRLRRTETHRLSAENSFVPNAVTQILRHVERALHRNKSFMR
jgi:hypothetical protein